MSFIISSGNEATPGVRRRTLSSRIEVGTVTLTFVILALALVVSLIYLAHANRTATRGYALKKLEIEKNQLQTEAEIWEQKVSEAESLNTITASPTVKGMQSVKDSIYIQPKEKTEGEEK